MVVAGPGGATTWRLVAHNNNNVFTESRSFDGIITYRSMARQIIDCLTDVFVSMDVDEEGTYAVSRGIGDATFDKIIGHIEDLLMEDEFQGIQHKFMEKHWHVFEPVDENKLIYTELFNEYNRAIESYLEQNLRKAVPNFTMNSLLDQLSARRTELEGEVFEVLATFTDFLAFKEMVLDYRAMKEGRVQDFSSGMSITSVKSSSSDSDDPVG